MLFDCPVCHERHSIQSNYDNSDYICENGPGRRNRRTFQDMKPNDLLSRNEPLGNRFSTKEDVQRAATVIVSGPDFRATGERIGKKEKNY